MFVVLDGSLNGFCAETEGCLHFHDKLVVDCASHSVVVVVLILRLVQAVPRMLLESIDIYTFGRISDENLCKDVLCIVREEFRK